MPRIGLGLGLGYPFYSSIDPAASAYFAATGLTGTTERNAVNTLVTSLKSAGLWSKMKAVYPFVTDNRNLLSYTEDFSNAFWSKLRTSVTSNATTAPDGTLTADAVFETAVTDFHGLENASAFTLVNGSTYTQSIYVKPVGRRYVALTTQWGGGTLGAWFDTQNVVVYSTDSGVTANITTANNGFYRITITRTSPATNGFMNVWYDDSTPTAGVYFTGNTYLGDVTKGFYLWGAQLELGSTATTYQPIATTQQSYISNQFKYNLVNPVDSDAAFRGVFNGGWTFSNQGALPNGTNGYMDTFFNPNTSLTYNSAHISFYSRTNNETSGSSTMGAVDAANNEIRLILRRPTNLGYFLSTDSSNGILDYTINNSTGLFIGNANGVNVRKLIRNGSVLTPLSQVPRGLGIWPSVKIYVGARSLVNVAGEYDNKQCAFSSIGDGLTDTEATALYNAVQTFNSSLQRQV